LERFEKIIGGESVATSFHALGIYDNETIRTMIIQIERDGYIPDEIMQHPAYEHARKNIIARLLRFHYMDKTQAAAQYDQWKKIPHVAKTALRFCRTISDLTAFEERMDSYHAMIEQYDE
jgi:hypothetical protein